MAEDYISKQKEEIGAQSRPLDANSQLEKLIEDSQRSIDEFFKRNRENIESGNYDKIAIPNKTPFYSQLGKTLYSGLKRIIGYIPRRKAKSELQSAVITRDYQPAAQSNNSIALSPSNVKNDSEEPEEVLRALPGLEMEPQTGIQDSSFNSSFELTPLPTREGNEQAPADNSNEGISAAQDSLVDFINSGPIFKSSPDNDTPGPMFYSLDPED